MNQEIYTIDEIIRIITPIAKKYGDLKVYLFGSYARGDADCDSDIDFRIDGGDVDTLFKLGMLYSELEQALKKPLDLITTESLRKNKDDFVTRKFIQSMMGEEKLIYEKSAG